MLGRQGSEPGGCCRGAGGKVAFVGRIGTDALGDEALAGYLRDGIDVGWVKRDPKPIPVWRSYSWTRMGEQHRGGFRRERRVSAADVEAARALIHKASVLLVQLEIPVEAVRAALRIASEYGVRTISHPAPACPLDDDLLKMVSIITPNETEAELLTGKTVADVRDAERAAAALIKRGAGAAILPRFARLVYLLDGIPGATPCFPAECVDTTAAGDVFNGALAVASPRGGDERIVRFASAAAAISVCRMGAQPSAPSRAEIDALLK